MKKFFNIKDREDKVGIYSTIIFHLVILIILLIGSIGATVKKESTFVLDFSKQEARQKEIEVQQMKDMVSEELDKILAQARRQNARDIRNVVVNANARLKDDKVYDDARKLQENLDAGKEKNKKLDQEDAIAEANATKIEPEKKKEEVSYSGPSVLSYSLDGRTMTLKKVPAYKGYGQGDVTVKIYVNRKGVVTEAKVVESVSSKDESLWKFAVQAAKASRFSASSTARDPQSGEIVYRFIAK